jgi:hypothetical protein
MSNTVKPLIKTHQRSLNCKVFSIADLLIIAYIFYDHGLFKSFCINKKYMLPYMYKIKNML